MLIQYLAFAVLIFVIVGCHRASNKEHWQYPTQ